MEVKNLSKFVMNEAGAVSRILKRNFMKQGLAPGELLHVGKKTAEDTRITVIDYSMETIDEKTLATPEECFGFRDTSSITWINIDGVHDSNVIEKIGNHFGLHPLVQEDIMNTGQRPKMEDFESYIYLVVKMLNFDETKKEVVSEQVSLILGEGYVLSFQERTGDVFDSVRKRIRTNKGRVRKCGSDYLAYVLLDSITDGYFGITEKIGEVVDILDTEIMDNPTPMTPRSVQRLRTELILSRKAIWPLRECINSLQRSESNLLTPQLLPYLNDLHDHTIQVADAIEALRDLVSGLRDTYLSSISNKMNEVMKVLTIIATIFIPITFVAGIYGMNFENMPELKWANGYFFALGVMGAMILSMLFYFKRKQWL